jgi:IS605 OrfB family transposase
VDDMKITKTVLLEADQPTDWEPLNQLMTVFCSALRFAFNRLEEGQNEKDLIKKVNALFHLNKRYAEDAVMQAKAVLSSQKELVPIRLEGVQAKIQKTEQKIEDYQTTRKTPKKVSLEICLVGLKARLAKLKEKEAVFLKHQKEETIPSVIFGGKKNFYERLKGKITNREWKELRSNTLYSRGDRSKKGNWLESKTFYCHEMEYVRSNRRNNIAGEIAKQIVDYLLNWNVGAFVLEDITLKQDHDTNHRFNRLTHSFAKNKLQKALISRGLKFSFHIKKVNPAYTSVIGRFKYAKRYGLSVHEAASFVIGRRGLDFDEKVPKELIQHLKEKVKPHLISFLGSMEESEKQSNKGKQRRRFMGMMLQNIEQFKEKHSWTLWNVVHKTLFIKNQELQLKEV